MGLRTTSASTDIGLGSSLRLSTRILGRQTRPRSKVDAGGLSADDQAREHREGRREGVSSQNAKRVRQKTTPGRTPVLSPTHAFARRRYPHDSRNWPAQVRICRSLFDIPFVHDG